MAVIHRTVLTPTEVELLAAWLPSRPWYRGTGTPELAKAGGFRVDDPQGEAGIEFVVVTDGPGNGPGSEAITYLVPLTYRGAPLEGPPLPSSARWSTACWGGAGPTTRATTRWRSPG